MTRLLAARYRSMHVAPRRAALFATCIVDQAYPAIAEATVTLLERLGVHVTVPAGQTCCGQPAFNAGYREDARAMAVQTLDVLRDAGDVVLPSGSCATMIRVHYPELLEDDAGLHAAALDLAGRTHELTEYIVDVLDITDVGARFDATLTIHDACHALRELGIRQQPRTLLSHVRGAQVVEAADSTRCCGFGGLFAVKFGAVSEAMAAAKAAGITETGADYAVTTDASCMMQINGRLSREGARCRVLHVAQVLAGAPLVPGPLQRATAPQPRRGGSDPERGDRNPERGDRDPERGASP
jgi:L-lactate dehydrogenase complex protein LldE